MREAPNLERMVGGIHTVDRGFTHFQYHTSSVIAHPIIYGGQSLITYSSMYILAVRRIPCGTS